MSIATTVSRTDTTPYSAAAALRRIFLSNPRVLDGMSWRRVGWVIVFAAIFSVYQLTRAFFGGGAGIFNAELGEHVDAFVQLFGRNLWGFFVWILVLTILGNLSLTRRQLTFVVLAAMIVNALASWPLVCVFFPAS